MTPPSTAGGVAGVSVDLILFPLDTIKTRLQSPQGFYKAGGFYGVYAGVPSTAIGSFPNAAAFFVTYEYVKWILNADSSSYLMPVTHMLAASAGEVVACLIRVPSEVVKQRAQVSASSGTFHIFSNILCQEGIQGLYRGYKSTVLRELVAIQIIHEEDFNMESKSSALPSFILVPRSRDSFLTGPVSLVGVLKSPLVLEARSCGGLLAVSSLWSFCRLVPAPQVGISSLPCTRFGGHRGCRGYLQVSSLGWQPSVWEVSSFLVLTTKLAAFCWNLAESAPESEMAPPFKKGPCCEKSFPSSEQLSSHLNNETQCGSPVPLGLQHGGHVFRAAGWLG
uniref:Mitochondrial S-adenosylmethionine carrier protein n=1 Tax=Capra hircus TaxID=9925 RepID=A0A8C2PJT8_CAPHI